jgi:mannose-1-phosphate guanylyltransferase / mannose-6-phosphate isomerase
MPLITPILLCGGSGTRLWPLSRKSYPKQFTPLLGPLSLFQEAAKRLSGAGYGDPIIVTNSDFRFIVTEQLAAIGQQAGAVLIEPEGRNTGPAILAAGLHALAQDPDAMLLVAPSDHDIPDADAFRAAVAAAKPDARQGQIITFGIAPTRPETGYGWLELAQPPSGNAPVPLARFVEKPVAAVAAQMLASGKYLWNAGLFLMRADALVAAFKAHSPAMVAPVTEALEGATRDLAFLRLAAEPWARAEATSIDYAVMERSDRLMAMPFGAGWSDLGDWDAVWRDSGKDEAGNAMHGSVTVIDCSNSLLRSEAEGTELVGIGLSNMIAVAMPDAVLIADRSRAQEVKEVVAKLKARGAKAAETFPRDHRPWGWFETLVLGDRFQVKRIVVNPGASLSLQSHVHRAEHWIVVSGTAQVTIADEVKLVAENQSVYIPLGAKHRMHNPGKVPMVLIEVQTGSYLGEDDIIRYEDVYSRGQGAKG